MKALTLTQPWASLVALNVKRYETRSWRTSYRGPLAIHAAKGMPKACADLCDLEPFRKALEPISGLVSGPLDWRAFLPRGEIVAIVKLAAIGPTEKIRDSAGFVDGAWPHERDFGDYGDGRFAWLMTLPLALQYPRPEVAGHLSLWEWAEPEYLRAEIEARR